MDEPKHSRDTAGEIERLRQREQRLIEVTTMFSSVTDLGALLEKIVESLRSVTCSDAGSLYIVQDQSLHFSVAQNDSKEIPFKAVQLPISPATIGGYVAQTGEILRFDDVYEIGDDKPFNFRKGSDFDRQIGYRTKSMLVIPLRNRKRDVVGVVQLINKKKDWKERLATPECPDTKVVSYNDDDIDFLAILASQAAMVIERASLYDGIERLLRGFVEASAKSIESRDRTTSGHSQRIAGYTVAMAKRINQETEGFWKDIKYTPNQIRELFYAAMLHDIGKIGVREYVLTKANKLSNDKIETIRLRICVEIMHDRSREAFWMDVWEFLKEVNIPTFLDDERLARLNEIAALQIRDTTGVAHPLLDPMEYENLAVRKGNLTDGERKEIESHVVHSAEILARIPWTDDLLRVPQIAGSHHERLSGKGYPHGWKKEEIPFEGRLLAVIDVFEALTAMDRPYKPAMPIPKALEVLRMEAKFDSLQTEIVEFFIEKKVYEVISDELRKEFTLTSDEILALS